MKLHIAAYEPERTGGGWSFQRNFAKAMGDDVVTRYDEADVYFISSASMVQRIDVEQAKRNGKRIVLRVDNIIRNSRNRNTGMTRMRDMAAMADVVVYQSQFAKGLLDDYLKPARSVVILNSTDEETFYPDTTRLEDSYLYAKYSSDETKNWEMARSAFQALPEPKHLMLVGRFDGNLEEYGFDFYQGERVSYAGMVADANSMASIYRSCGTLLYSYFNDACSNTLIEALMCGLRIQDCYGMTQTGGAPEILRLWEEEGPAYFSLCRMADDYREVIGV